MLASISYSKKTAQSCAAFAIGAVKADLSALRNVRGRSSTSCGASAIALAEPI